MKRATIILLLLVSCLIPGAVAAGEYPILDNQMETRHAHITWTLTIQEISMEAVVDYIDEVSEGNGTATLNAILTEFRSKMAEVGSYTTHIGLNNLLRDLRDTTTRFRTESRSRMTDYDGKGIVLLIRIAERLADSQGRLDPLKNQYWATRKANVLQNFDIRVERAQTVLDRLTERDYDTSAAQAELDEIETLRSDLEAALDAMDNVRILGVSLDALERSIALAQTIRDLQLEIPPTRIVTHWVNVSERVVDRTGTIIDELTDLGLDTTELAEIHGNAKAHLAEAKADLEACNYLSAAGALTELKDDLLELRDAYVDLVFPEGTPSQLETAMETMGGKLEEIAGKMTESLDSMQ